MTTPDPSQQRQQLAASYSEKSDAELERIAAEAHELTDIAHETLRAELVRRGLYHGQMDGEQESEGAELREMVTVRQFRDLPEALFAKGSLESAGLECALIDDNMVRLDWFISNLLGGVKLRVAAEDAAAANEILNQAIPESFDAGETGEFHQPRCPECGSLEVSFQQVNKPVAYTTAYLGVPLPLRYRAWRCQSCKAEWEETNNAGSETGPPESTS